MKSSRSESSQSLASLEEVSASMNALVVHPLPAELPSLQNSIRALQQLSQIHECLVALSDHDESFTLCAPLVRDLEEMLLERLVSRREGRSGGDVLTVAVVGDFSSGKSTFINALLGEDICPVDPRPTTSSITYFTYGSELRIERAISDDRREVISHDEYVEGVAHGESDEPTGATAVFHIELPSPELSQLRLVDTPGFNNPHNPSDTLVTEDALRHADVLFVVFDIQKGNPSAQLLEQLSRIRQSSDANEARPAYLLLNKAALQRSKTTRAEILEENRKLHGELFDEILLVDSLELAASEDEAAISRLRALFRELEGAIHRRAQFHPTIQAEKAKGEDGKAAYLLTLDSPRAIALPLISKDDLARRDQLKEVLEQVRARRRELSERREHREEYELLSTWHKTLQHIRNIAANESDEEYDGEHSDIFLDETELMRSFDQATSGIRDDITNRLVEVSFDILDGAITERTIRTKGFIWDNFEYRLEFDRRTLWIEGEEPRIARAAKYITRKIYRALNKKNIHIQLLDIDSEFIAHQIARLLRNSPFWHKEPDDPLNKHQHLANYERNGSTSVLSDTNKLSIHLSRSQITEYCQTLANDIAAMINTEAIEPTLRELKYEIRDRMVSENKKRAQLEKLISYINEALEMNP